MRYPCAFLILTSLISGCANIIDSKLMSSKSIFLTPGATKTIYIQNRNISENQQVSLNDLAGKLVAKGYKVLQDPDQAQFLLQTKVVYCNKEKDSVSLQSVLAAGFGAGIGSTNPGMGGDMGGMGMMGGMPDISAMMAGMGGMGMPQQPQDDTVQYFCVVDVQVTEQGKGSAAGGAAKPVAALSSGQPNQIRIVAGVRQKKLDLEEATPIVREKLTTGVAGMF